MARPRPFAPRAPTTNRLTPTDTLVHKLATERETTILVPPVSGPPRGALLLWPVLGRHLVKGPWDLRPDMILAVTWSKEEGGRLEVVTGYGWTVLLEGHPQRLRPLDFTAPIKGRPQPVLEALAVVVDLGLEVVITRRQGDRRLRRVVLNPDRQLLVAEDLDRDAPRSFKLGDVEAVELAAGCPVPTWGDGWGYELPGQGVNP